MAQEQVAAQLAEAASLMLVGMVVVFGFLVILIVAVNLLSWFCQKFPGETVPQFTPSAETAVRGQSIPSQHIAAITAALAQRKKR